MCLVLLAAALLLTSCSGSSGGGTGSGTAPPPTAADTSPFVTTSGDHFVGRGGQLVQLRGFNIHTLDPAVYQEAVTLGANFIRVTTPWSDYETVPPTGDVHHWDMARLAELDQLVSFCNDHHISLLLDFHQYGWSPYFAAVQRGGRANGIPAWFYQDGRYPITPRGLDRAKEQFFNDPEGAALYGDFAAMMAERYRHSPSVMGYEIMNEPDTGTLPRNHATTQLVVRWEAQVLGRLRAVDDTRTTVFMLRGGPSMGALHADLTDFGPLGHLALDVHDYFAGTGGSGYKPDGENVSSQYTSTLQGAPYTGTLASQAAYLDVGVRAARRFGVPLIEGEWGAFRSMPGIEVYQSQMVTLLDSKGISWARWSLDRAEELSVLNRDGSPTPAATQLQQLLHSSPVTTTP
jgi:Cellulase (glycosyl hydrolase family 5)